MGYHICDDWIVFNDFSTFMAPIVVDPSMSFMNIMYRFDIVLLLIFDGMTLTFLKSSCCSAYFIRCVCIYVHIWGCLFVGIYQYWLHIG